MNTYVKCFYVMINRKDLPTILNMIKIDESILWLIDKSRQVLR